MKLFIFFGLLASTATVFGQENEGCAEEAEIDGCLECWNPGYECLLCDDHYLMKDTSTCLSCPAHCFECKDSDMNDETECVFCDDGYRLLDDETCYWCLDHCNHCYGDWTCEKCEHGYHVEKLNPVHCLECARGCSKCLNTGAESCYECLSGYYLTFTNEHTGRCDACLSHCASCTSSTDCIRCEDGYIWHQAHCIPCPDNCAEGHCTSSGGCSRCQDNYFLTDDRTECRSCDHCTSCPFSGGCTSCDRGYILNSDRTCHTCPEIENDEYCNSCGAEGQGRVFIGGACLYCPPHCEECSDEETCTDCADGYYLEDDLCHACHEECATCYDSGSYHCDSCVEGKSVNPMNGMCEECPESTGASNCATCMVDDCLTCEDGHFYSPADHSTETTCRACEESDPNESPEVCVQCRTGTRGRYMTADKCLSCFDIHADCVACNSSGCVVCADHTYVQAGDPNVCDDCDDGVQCLHCTDGNEGSCTECAPFYYLREGFCESCPAGCESCDNAYSCNQCTAGWLQTAFTMCAACSVQNCKSCSMDIDDCRVCDDRHYTDDSGDVTVCTPCEDTNCVRCPASPGECQQCDPGYLLYNGQCQHECQSQCDDCNTATLNTLDIKCGLCATGTYKSFQKQCHACSSSLSQHCIGCAGNPDYCTECGDGYYADAGDCTACDAASPNFCSTCTSATTCTSCIDGHYFHSGSSTCYDCTIVHAECTECSGTGATDCTACADGYFEDSGTCTVCDTSACQTCTTANNFCVICMDGSVASSGDGSCGQWLACLPGDPHCLACFQASCATCDVGYGTPTPSGNCVACPATCTDCTADTTCTSCRDGYTLTSMDTCEACTDVDSRCTSCDYVGPTLTCMSCQTNYYVDNNECLPCIGGLSNCAVCNDEECLECNDDYYLVDEESCQDCPSNCQECPNADSCTTCAQGYVVDYRGECQACPDNCLDCVDTDECVECAEGYSIGDDDLCFQCPIGCAGCTSDPVCTSCITGYVLLDFRCRSCPPGCDACSSEESCGQCADHFTVTPLCTECSDLHCAVCNDVDTCTSCETGYYLDVENNLCHPCSLQCDVCSSTGCQQCAEHYELIDNVCVEVSSDQENCAEEEEHVCIRCNFGYYLDPTTKLCFHCDTAGKDTASYVCQQCSDTQEGNHRNNQQWVATCQDCPEHCLACHAGDSCDECEEGYYPYGEGCAVAECAAPSDITNPEHCRHCSDVYYSTGDEYRGLTWSEQESTCQECPRNCRRCNTADTCSSLEDECRDHYVWNEVDGLCVECNFGNVETCSGCLSEGRTGRYYDGEQCKLCPADCIDCGTDPTTCVECSNAFYLQDSNCFSCYRPEITQAGCIECQSKFEPWQTNAHAWMLGNTENDEDERTFGCHACPELCAECYERNTCERCSDHLYFYSNPETETYQCRPCLLHCDECSDADTCMRCEDGYRYVQGRRNTCQQCSPTCAQCDHKDGCIECIDGYYLDETHTCITCDSALENCDRCSLREGRPTCSDCSPNHFLLNGICYACLDHCAVCRDAETCTECQAGYCYDDFEHACRDNILSNCNACQMRSGGTSCLDCEPHWYLDLCQACEDEHCQVCDRRGDQCELCDEQYYVHTDGSCQSCPSACDYCHNGESCEACREGTFWNEENLACAACIPMCLNCTDATTCEAAACAFENMYYDDSLSTHSCNFCLTGCASCVGPSDCGECSPGYYPAATDGADNIVECAACDSGCEVCSAENCTQCFDGYALNSLEACDACSQISQCLQCVNVIDDTDLSERLECLVCGEGYTLSEDRDKCTICPLVGCAVCQDRDYICELCEPGLLQTFDLYGCGTPCWECIDSDECQTVPPNVNSTESMNDDAYEAVGCLAGCWVSQTIDVDGSIVHRRGCSSDPDVTCDAYRTEMCTTSGNITECALCCEGNYCNTAVLEGPNAGSASLMHNLLVMLVAVLLSCCAVLVQ